MSEFLPSPPRIPGPDPEPLAPIIPTPPLACDCHAHIFGPAERFPYTDRRGYTPPDAPCEAYLAMLARIGFSRGVCVQGNAHGYDNAAILDAAARHPAHLRAIGIADTSVPPKQLRQWHAQGMRGLRFHLFGPGNAPNYKRGVGLDALAHFAPMMRELGWHAQFWVDWRTFPAFLPQLSAVARHMPVVIDHMLNIPARMGVSHPSFSALIAALGKGICWVKLSGAYRVSSAYPDYPDARPFHVALIRANPDHLIWGTDWPHPQVEESSMPNDGHLLNIFNDWTGENTIRRKILVDNPARLYFWE